MMSIISMKQITIAKCVKQKLLDANYVIKIQPVLPAMMDIYQIKRLVDFVQQKYSIVIHAKWINNNNFNVLIVKKEPFYFPILLFV